LIIHVVRPNDTIYRLAQAYGVPYEQIISDNGLENPEVLVPGQTIVIMTDTIPHTVTPVRVYIHWQGDTGFH
jgi:spore germination protein